MSARDTYLAATFVFLGTMKRLKASQKCVGFCMLHPDLPRESDIKLSSFSGLLQHPHSAPCRLPLPEQLSRCPHDRCRFRVGRALLSYSLVSANDSQFLDEDVLLFALDVNVQDVGRHNQRHSAAKAEGETLGIAWGLNRRECEQRCPSRRRLSDDGDQNQCEGPLLGRVAKDGVNPAVQDTR